MTRPTSQNFCNMNRTVQNAITRNLEIIRDAIKTLHHKQCACLFLTDIEFVFLYVFYVYF